MINIFKRFKKCVEIKIEEKKFNNLIDAGFELFFLQNKDILNSYFLEQVTNLVVNQYNISLVFVTDEVIVSRSGNECAGLYAYKVNNKTFECFNKVVLNNVEYSNVSCLDFNSYPCIYIANNEPKSKALTLLHELGHHIIHVNGLEQSEELADAYIRIFVEEKLNPLFQYVYRITLDVYSKIEKKPKLTYKEAYLKYYIPFLESNPEMNLPKIKY